MDLTLDAFMAQLGEASSANPMGEAKGIMQTAEMVARRAKKEYGLSVDDAQYVLKDLLSDIDKKGDTDSEGTDRFVQSYISTIAKDRVNEVILPEGVMLKDYNELKIVLFGHDYSALGMGKSQWVVLNDRSNPDKMFSLLAKTIFASAKANPLAEQVYQWIIEGMPMGDSIGFIPVEWVEPADKGWDKVYDAWVKRATAFLKTKGREATAAMLEGLERIFTKVIMLEFSKVMMPCNQFAVTLAIEKGLLLDSQAKSYTIEEPKELAIEDETEDALQEEESEEARILTIIRRELNQEDAEEKEGRRFSKTTLKALDGVRTAAKASSEANQTVIEALDILVGLPEDDADEIGEEVEAKDIEAETDELEEMTPEEAESILDGIEKEKQAAVDAKKLTANEEVLGRLGHQL